MRLSTLIEDTLYEIARGIERARARSKDLIAISPSSMGGQKLEELSYVDFDVSIVVGETTEGKTGESGEFGGEIQVASIFKAGGKFGGSSGQTNSNSMEQTHRVAFKVPVYFQASFKNNPAAAEAAAIVLNSDA